jgi:hypothetical protein
MRVWRQSPVAHGIDAAVKGVQETSLHEAVYLPFGESYSSKLSVRDNAGLPASDLRNRRPDATRTSLTTATVVNLVRVGHAPESPSKNVTRGSRRATTP